ncbi:hypothetical protein BLA29_008228 [Euroglyphus maynei]|uniref:Insulin-like domain-containing protein n=1 Tax=Euroglyphus maynei TaxID=6958 RepID=A0A1Y3BSB3_EURMA|nr:hypothetical protein BLA29_008228 [Euroglyphus maynei]
MQLVCNGQYNGPSISPSSMIAPVAAQPSFAAGDKMLRQVRRMVFTIHPQQRLPSLPLSNRLNISLARLYYPNNNHCGFYPSLSTSSSTIDHQDNHEASIQTSYVPDQHDRVRVRRGIVDECCYGHCSYQDMRKYCAASPNNNNNNNDDNDDQRIKPIITKSTNYHDQ